MSSRPEPTATYALIGAAGYIAPRHMAAIRDTGGRLAVGFDVNDSVGVIDSFAPDAAFFIDFERFAADLERRKTAPGERVTHVSVCSPNHLHHAHAAAALRADADVICEKPLVIEPALLDDLALLERASGRRIYTILQLRHHPAILALKDRVAASGRHYDVLLTYITSRGRWYAESWKGDPRRSGGIAMNIGIHFFDMLSFVFGPLRENRPHLVEPNRASGCLDFENARVRWFLSIDRGDLPSVTPPRQTTYRSITLDGEEVEFSGGFTDLHTVSYQEILAGRGYGLDAARASVEASFRVHNGPLFQARGDAHPMLDRARHA